MYVCMYARVNGRRLDGRIDPQALMRNCPSLPGEDVGVRVPVQNLKRPAKK